MKHAMLIAGAALAALVLAGAGAWHHHNHPDLDAPAPAAMDVLDKQGKVLGQHVLPSAQ